MKHVPEPRLTKLISVHNEISGLRAIVFYCKAFQFDIIGN